MAKQQGDAKGVSTKLHDPAVKNLEVLQNIRVNGEHVQAGSVIPKSKFNVNRDWLNLATMTPPKVKQTDAKLKEVKASDAKGDQPAGGGIPSADA